MNPEPQSAIVVYGADWCEDTRRCLRLLRRLHVRARYVNIDENLAGLERALALNNGQRRTPIIDLGLGGPVLVEPSNELLAAALVEHRMLSGDDAYERLALQNVGDLERIGRMIAGVGLLAAAEGLPRRSRWPLRLLGGIAAATGLVGWCPVYYAARLTSIGGPGDRPDEAERDQWLRTQEPAPRVPVSAAS